MAARKWVLAAVAVAEIAGAIAWFLRPDFGWKPGQQDGAPPRPELVERGRYLARVGDCIACHTVQGGSAYAGGRGVPTPFGTLYSSNLTPDAGTGLGRWSEDDFWNALHLGRSKDGRRLYPAFPYTNYSLVTREDADAIFAFLRSLPPVTAPQRRHELRFPYDTQLALRFWRALYFRPHRKLADADGRPEAWRRGAYLVEGLGHCNACHTQRTWLGGIESAADYAGGPLPAPGWEALPLTSEQPMSDAQAQETAQLLKAGTSRDSVMTGPMAEVVFHSLQHLDDADIAAMVAYIRTLAWHAPEHAPVPPVPDRLREEMMQKGEGLYRDHCAGCHGAQGEGKPYQYPALAGNKLVTAESPVNAIEAVLFGGYGPSTAAVPQPYGMPSYAHQLPAQDIAAVLTFVRASWGNQAQAVPPVMVERH